MSWNDSSKKSRDAVAPVVSRLESPTWGSHASGRFRSARAGSSRLRCPLCPRDGGVTPQTLRADLPWCEEHDRALVDVSLLGDQPPGILGTLLGGRYVVLERLAVGATSSVFRARDLTRRLDVALKVVPAQSPFFGETRLRFAQEARTLAQLESPHVVRVFEFGELSDGSCFLAMELLRGETLGARMRRGPLMPREAIRITEGALKALVEAHGKGVVHRDLKPDNLFLLSSLPGQVDFCKVVDFGIARLAPECDLESRMTESGTVLGTPRYMSPEQARGLAVDGRSDLYSLGVILFQMLTGAPPFVAPDPVLVMAKHVRELPPSLTSVAPHLSSAPRLVALVRRVLSKSPEDRPQSAGEFLAALDGVRRELGILTATTTAAGTVSVPASVRRRRSGTRWYLLLSAAACLGFIGLGWLARTSSELVTETAALGSPVEAEPLVVAEWSSAPGVPHGSAELASAAAESSLPTFSQQFLEVAVEVESAPESPQEVLAATLREATSVPPPVTASAPAASPLRASRSAARKSASAPGDAVNRSSVNRSSAPRSSATTSSATTSSAANKGAPEDVWSFDAPGDRR